MSRRKRQCFISCSRGSNWHKEDIRKWIARCLQVHTCQQMRASSCIITSALAARNSEECLFSTWRLHQYYSTAQANDLTFMDISCIYKPFSSRAAYTEWKSITHLKCKLPICRLAVISWKHCVGQLNHQPASLLKQAYHFPHRAETAGRRKMSDDVRQRLQLSFFSVRTHDTLHDWLPTLCDTLWHKQ